MTAVSRGRDRPSPGAELPVWDLPTRAFHWALAALVTVSWFTGEEPAAAALHRFSGEAIAGLLVFRLVWGFVGGEHARFAEFVRGPRPVAEHLRQLLRGRAEASAGHNPLGGLSVLLLLAAVTFVVVTGLFSAGEEGAGGPLAGRFGLELSGLHEPAFRVLQGLVLLHLIGVAATSLAARENLVRAMITGSKRRDRHRATGPARRASVAALLFAIGFGASVSAALMSAPPSAPGRLAGESAQTAGADDGPAPEEREE